VIYLATAPKSNAAYMAYKAATRAAKEGGSLLPPKHILNAPTKLMKSEGYGDGYQYDHDEPEAFSGQDYFPEALAGRPSTIRRSAGSSARSASGWTAKPEVAPAPLPTAVQNVIVTPDENGMRVDRFLEAHFPGLSFSHIQRIVRKGELRVNGKRADSKDRLEEGQTVRIPPLKLDAPKVSR
jgi:hypothetical protein